MIKYPIRICREYITYLKLNERTVLYTLFLISADGQFVKSSIAEFVFSNKLPLVTAFSRDNAPAIFESPIKKQVNCLCSCCNYKFDCNEKFSCFMEMMISMELTIHRCCCLLLQMIQRRFSLFLQRQQNFLRERYGCI